MRIVLAAGLVIFAGTGCSTNSANLNRNFESDRGEVGPPYRDRIEISAGSSSGLYGGPQVRSTWILDKNGNCAGSATNGTNAGSLPSETKKYQVPSEVFEECRALLRETNFFCMPQRNQPQFLFENSASSVTVKWNGREHSVLVIDPATPPMGFDKLHKFVDELTERGKEMR